MKWITSFSLLFLGMLLLWSLYACAEAPKDRTRDEVIADGVVSEESYAIPRASNEVFLENVTKPALLELIFFQLKGSQAVVNDLLEHEEGDGLYGGNDVIAKHRERVTKEADLLSRLVSIDADDSEAIKAVYDELLVILEVSKDPEKWLPVGSTKARSNG
ncbi:hypothetical protein CE91St33_14540 [Eggerthella lenta]|nr:hypothetical protein CE91St33_14540 [Eggerthella lenta]